MDELVAALPPAVRAHLLVALRAHIRQFSTDGYAVPADLAAFLAELDPQRDALAHRRKLAAERSRRYRLRKKQEAELLADQSA